jgi:hypothetical protein
MSISNNIKKTKLFDTGKALKQQPFKATYNTILLTNSHLRIRTKKKREYREGETNGGKRLIFFLWIEE